MKCDLCSHDKKHAVRVNSWKVCQECSASGILRSAIAAQDNVRQLRDLLANAKGQFESDVQIQITAMDRIKRAQHELDASIDALIPLIAKTSESRIGSRDATDNVGRFETTHPFLVDTSDSKSESAKYA